MALSPTRRAAALVVVGAALLAASYPPFDLPVLSFVAVAPAVILLRHLEQAHDLRGALRWGFWYGFASQGVVLYWLVVALWHFTPLSALGYLATITIFGLWHALLFWFVTRARRDLPAIPLWAVFPVAWTAVEWAVGHQGDIRFPWLGLGTSLGDATTLVQWADIAGARGVTLWLAWCNVMVVEAMLGERGEGRGSFRWRPAVAVFATVLAAWGYGTWRERTLPLRDVGIVGLLQPNEGFQEKWDPGHADSMVSKLVGMSRALVAEQHPRLLLWPEAAIPGYFFQHPAWPAAIGGVARETKTPIFTGGLYAEFHPDGGSDYYNAAFYFDTAGRWQPYPVYQKHYLVPIVERVPFVPPRWLQLKWFGGFGIGRGLPLYASPLGRFGVMICYESAFEALARGYRRTGAEFLVNITNDAWYGRTAGPYQHATHLVMRAIETRAGIARAANDGISELVDPLGRTSIETGLEQQAAVAGVLRTSDVVPLYVRWGDWVGTLVVLTTLGLAGWLFKKKWTSERAP
ncbi:MAG TPA: apolipoprotein N-acyltransferase [Gemmatimonadales bacterium]|nr:apolipoprotein N-acyltransferase [Gemmatimonadales bacterium]